MVFYFSCRIRTCKAKLNIMNKTLSIRNDEHSHGSQIPALEENKFLSLIKERAAQESKNRKDIFEEEQIKLSSGNAARNITYKIVESSMRYRRKKAFPKLPKTLKEVEELFAKEDVLKKFGSSGGKPFYRECIYTPSGDDAGVVFVSTEILEAIENKPLNYNMDSTFSPSPKSFYQLFIVHVNKNEKAFPFAYILMKRKLETHYLAILNFLKTLGIAPTRLMCDFETGLMNAAKEIFPNAVIKGCWFHSSQAYRKNWASIIPTEAKKKICWAKVLAKIIHLPLLPAGLILTGFNIIKEEIQQIEKDEMEAAAATRFVDYFQSYWLNTVGVGKMSVFKDVQRTNNYAESFHSRFNRKIQKCPRFWQVLMLFGEENMKQELAFENAFQNLKDIPKKLEKRNRKINLAQNLLIEKRISVDEFLQLLVSKEGMDAMEKFPGRSVFDLNMDNELFAETDEVEHSLNHPGNDFSRDSNLENNCVLCGVQRRTIFLRPCMHLLFCASCFPDFVGQQKFCPKCSKLYVCYEKIN